MSLRIVDLPWLPDSHPEWLETTKALTAETPQLGITLQKLASARIDGGKALRLSRALTRLRGAAADLTPLASFRLGIVSAHTLDLALDDLPAAGLRHGVAIEIFTTPYGQIMQSVLDSGSNLYTSSLDAVLIAVDHHWFGWDGLSIHDCDAVNAALAQMESIVAALQETKGIPPILQTLASPPSTLFGSLDAAGHASLRAAIAQYNSGLVDLAKAKGAYILDVADLAARVGGDLWFNPMQWASYKMPFDASVAPIYADWLARVLAAIRGKSAKCLVLDLDNTLWGGVIGDDGLEGIILGQGNAKGEAFLALQRAVLDLRERGVFIAIASKNTDSIARIPFREHPEMLLREDHISAFVANWTDKATNLEQIAASLNIGVDSLLFFDDNPAERAQVRGALPAVCVPELPADPSWYSWILSAGGWFEAVTVTDEDRARVEMQRLDAARATIRSTARDLREYLHSLEMIAEFSSFNRENRNRITQLINKTNQFNLTTRRYTESEVAVMEEEPGVQTLQFRLRDRFGDLGIVGVVICLPDGRAAWNIDTWLMSCRVLGRELEAATLSVLVQIAKERNIETLQGRYVPTEKNGLVAEMYDRLGFSRVGTTESEVKEWILDMETFSIPDLPMKIEIISDHGQRPPVIA